MPVRFSLFAACVLPCLPLVAQEPKPSLSGTLNRVEEAVSLTHGSPFHAEMQIDGADNESEYHSRIVVDWASPTKNRVEVRSAHFHQVKTTADGQVQEQNEGDFYPGWLHGFATALLDPMFAKTAILSPGAQISGSRSSNGSDTQACVKRNDRPDGITDDLTWSGLCISSSGQVTESYDFTTWMDYSNFRKFHQQQVAARYESFTGSYDKLLGTLTTLRDLTPAEVAEIRITAPTPKERQIAFTFISTKAEEARLESAKPFEWPPVREGKTEGYMIVHAATDVTGQVRESSKHNSDNPGLEEAGRQAALGYKFKPMLVDGVPAEMEMPLVLHFKTTQGIPLPFLKGEEISKVSSTCHSPIQLSKGVGEPGHHYHVKISVNEEGKLTGESFPDGYPDLGLVRRTVNDCNFGIYRIDGKPTYYHVELEFVAPQ